MKHIDKKRQKLKELIQEFQTFAPTPLPTHPNIEAIGLIPEQCNVFLSGKSPLLLAFKTTQDTVVKLIYKNGDDLRQDQLILQQIKLMDSLLRQENLNMELAIYNVVATSQTDGFIELVPDSENLQDIIKRESLNAFLAKNQSNFPKIYDSFISSSAAYCVITYILGVGDRHLENLMVQKQGNLFHIDFGYIFGRDPKPFPPPMKLCKEMVEAMGGSNAQGYFKFQRKSCEVFLALRKHAKLISNLLHLSLHAKLKNLDDIKQLEKLHARFRLELNDQMAEDFMLNLLQQSVSSLFPQIMEKVHIWAQYWRQ